MLRVVPTENSILRFVVDDHIGEAVPIDVSEASSPVFPIVRGQNGEPSALELSEIDFVVEFPSVGTKMRERAFLGVRYER